MIVRFTDRKNNVNYVFISGNDRYAVKRETELKQKTADGDISIPLDDDSDIDVTDVKEVLYGSNDDPALIFVKMGDKIFSYEKTDVRSLINDVQNYVFNSTLPDKVALLGEEFETMCSRVSSVYASIDDLGNMLYISTDLDDVKANNKGFIWAFTPEMADFVEITLD